MIFRLLSGCLLLVPTLAVGQVATVAPDSLERIEVDRDDVRGRAEDAQARFERARLRYSPLRFGTSGIDCDEYVGRFCTTYHEGEWYPRPDPEEIGEARDVLLAELDSLQVAAPGDAWILGQRVFYRGDGGDWASALEAARDCGAEAWWCHALEGLSLHGLGRYAEAEDAFSTALEAVDPSVAIEWRVPERAVDRDTRRMLREWREHSSERLSQGLTAFWALADPLYLVDGNDRRTAHYARWTVSEIRRDARNPYGLRWADDLEELTVRHGWEIGYERTRTSIGMSARGEGATGHKHPEGRDFMPSGDVLEDPTAAGAEDLVADRRRPRSLYAPAYAPVLLPIEAQIAVFPREGAGIVVATSYLPEDTTFHAEHDHPRPWSEAGDQAHMPEQIGIFALPAGGGAPSFRATASGSEGALMLELPVGAYVVSSESWSPPLRRAGRFRAGVEIESGTPDVAVASDLLLLRGGPPTPGSLEEAVSRALPRTRIEPGDAIAIAWEVTGLGFRPETLEYAVSVERTDRNVFSRIGDFLGLSDRPQPLALSWDEQGPGEPGHQFRYLDLDLPELDRGEYEIALTLRTRGRSEVVSTRHFEVVDR